MKPVTRRSIMAGSIAAVAAVPAIGLGKSNKSEPSNDPLLDGILSYRQQIEALNAPEGPTADDEIDGWVDRTDTALAEALGYPVVSVAGAIAVIGLVVNEPELIEHSRIGDRLQASLQSARDFLAGRVA